MRTLLRLTAAGAIMASLFVGAAPTAQARKDPAGTILHARTPARMPGTYIVVLKNNAAVRRRGVHRSATDLAGKHRGSVEKVFTKVVKGFSAILGEGDASRLAAEADVAYVERDQRIAVTETTTRSGSWGLDRIDQRAGPLSRSYTYSTTASNVHAYVIDSGILTTHHEFGGRAVSGYDFVDGDNDATDCNGHGTHVAGTVGGGTYGVAKGVHLVAVRVSDCKGRTSTSRIISAVEWVTANAIKPAVANISLGGGASAALDTAVANSISSGVTYVVAAGNNHRNASRMSPARVRAAVTVGATRRADARADYSNFGRVLDIFAPGSDITSAWFTSPSATKTISGTSMAAPHVTGAAALILAGEPSLTPAQVSAALASGATTGMVSNPGPGSPNLLLHTGSASPESPAPASPPPPWRRGERPT